MLFADIYSIIKNVEILKTKQHKKCQSALNSNGIVEAFFGVTILMLLVHMYILL
jgi:hypothetical protein